MVSKDPKSGMLRFFCFHHPMGMSPAFGSYHPNGVGMYPSLPLTAFLDPYSTFPMF